MPTLPNRRKPTVTGDAAKVVDPKERQRIERSLTGKEQAPSQRAQLTFVSWKQLGQLLGQPFDAEAIPYSKLRQMRRDPMISFGMHYVKTPLVRAPWRIEPVGSIADAGPTKPAQVAAFVDNALRDIYGRYIFQRCLALDFGFSAMVKRFQLEIPNWTWIDPEAGVDAEPARVWDEGSVEAITWKPFVALNPEAAEPAWVEKTGEFNGIKYQGAAADEGGGSTGSASQKKQDEPDIDVYHSLWATNERDSVFGSLYGYPRIGYAYRYWWSYWFRWALYDRYFERASLPPIVAWHPDGVYVDPSSNEELEFRDVAVDAASRARANGIITMPSEVVETMDDRTSNLRQWDIKYLDGGDPKIDFDESFSYLDVMKLRSMWVPEQAFIEGEGGSSSRNVAAQMAEIFIQSQTNLMTEIDDEINRFLIPQLVRMNFPEFTGQVRKVTSGFGQEDIDFMKQVIQLVGQDDWRELGVDVPTAMERVGIPTLSPAQMAAERERLAQEQQAPAVTEPGAGGVGVIPDEGSATGFSYIQGREAIHLSADAEMMAALPDSRHFTDPEARKLAVRLQKLYKKDYTERVKDFAQFLEGSKIELSGNTLRVLPAGSERLTVLELADDDADEGAGAEIVASGLSAAAAKKLAEKLVSAWVWPQEKLAQLGEATANLYGKIFKVALSREAEEAGFERMPDKDAIDSLVTDRADYLQEQTHSSLKDELTVPLVDALKSGKTEPQELAEEVREHFSERPDSKSETLAVTETVGAWNEATLMLAETNETKQVQALDARLGPTDRHCEDRDGKILSVRQAQKENRDRRHPWCTLAFRILKPQVELSFETRDDLNPDRIAEFDSESNVVYFSEDISHPEEKRYLLGLGEALKASA